jgi:FK506-binding nuclear protein
MAAIDPTAIPILEDGDDHKVPRATLKLIHFEDDMDSDEDDDDEDIDPEDIEALRAKLRAEGVLGSDDDSDMSDEDSEEEANGGPSDPAKSKEAKRAALEKKLKEDLDAEEMELDSINGKSKGKGKAINGDIDSESDEDLDDDDDEDIEESEVVMCTLDREKVSHFLPIRST